MYVWLVYAHTEGNCGYYYDLGWGWGGEERKDYREGIWGRREYEGRKERGYVGSREGREGM